MLNRLVFPMCAVALVAVQGLAVAGNGSALMKQIPETTQIVVVFDVAEARDSPLLQTNFQKMLDSNPDAGAKLAAFGIDPMKDIDTVMFAGGGVSELGSMKDASQMVLIVEGRVPKKAMESPSITKTKHRNIEIFTKDDTEAAFVGKNLLFTKKGGMQAAIDIATGKGKNAQTSPKAKALRTAIAATNIQSDAWMVVLVPDKDKTNMSQNGLAMESISLALKMETDLAATLSLNTPSEADAAKGVTLFQSVLPTLTQSMGPMGLGKAAKSLLISQDKAAIKATGTLTAAEVNTLMVLASGGPPPPPPAATKPPGPVIPKTGGLGGAAPTAPAPKP